MQLWSRLMSLAKARIWEIPQRSALCLHVFESKIALHFQPNTLLADGALTVPVGWGKTFPNKYHSFSGFFFSFGKKTGFWPKNCFSAKRNNGRFSVILAGMRSAVIVGHFFNCPDDPTKFRRPGSKIKGTYNSEVTKARNGQKTGWAPENDP